MMASNITKRQQSSMCLLLEFHHTPYNIFLAEKKSDPNLISPLYLTTDYMEYRGIENVK